MQGDLVSLLKELLRHTKHCELVIFRLHLGQAGLHDEDTNRDSAGTAEIPDVNQALPCADLEARGSAAVNPKSLPLEQVREEIGPTFLVMQPEDTSLRLAANLILSAPIEY